MNDKFSSTGGRTESCAHDGPHTAAVIESYDLLKQTVEELRWQVVGQMPFGGLQEACGQFCSDDFG